MKHMLRLLILLLISSPALLYGQGPFDGIPTDSTIIRFNGGMIAGYHPDTATLPLWQIGRTHKSFFTADTAGTVAIMTDTLIPYPVNANNWFSIRIPDTFSTVGFWHKYQTTTGRDGGIVEFSLDGGVTWQNIKGNCNTDATEFPGILTYNCYSALDTLASGDQAFTGTKDTLQYSRIMFYPGPPVKLTSGGGCTFSSNKMLRFRFVSDSIADSLAGWMIDSIKMEEFVFCCGGINTVQQHSLHIAPNPSLDGHFSFPALIDEEQYTISIYNALGQRVSAQPYKQSLDLSHYANGLYFYSATNGSVTYTGRLLKE